MNTIQYTQATSQDVLEVLNAIEPAVEGRATGVVNMACLALVLFNLKPSITLDEMVEGVKAASEWMGLYVLGTDAEPLPEA